VGHAICWGGEKVSLQKLVKIISLFLVKIKSVFHFLSDFFKFIYFSKPFLILFFFVLSFIDYVSN